jgi:predicted Na+-dependent transporter
MALTMFGQFVILPLIGYAMARAFDLDPIQAIGLIVITTVPVGSTANIFALMFHADIPLAVSATTFSSFLAIALMPLNQYLYISVSGLAGNICIQVSGIVLSAFIVLIGVAGGMLIKPILQKRKMFTTIKVLFGIASAAVVAILVLAFYSNLASQLPFYKVGGNVAAAAIVVCLLAVLFAFVASTVARLPKPTRITVCLEIGIQNAFVAIAVINLLFTDPGHRGAALSAPTLFGVFGLILSIGGCILAWKCGQTDLDPHANFIKAFKEAQLKRHEETNREIYGDDAIVPGNGDVSEAKVADAKVADGA